MLAIWQRRGPLFIAIFASALVSAWVYTSFLEWVFHRFVMHRPAGPLRHIFIGHAKVHHGTYHGDWSYVTGDRDADEITFGWWLMPLPVLVHVPAAVGIYLLIGLAPAAGFLTGFLLYQVTYEYLHFCMHVPQGRWLERQWVFQWVNDHHLQHHRKPFTNLNVFFPVADFVLRSRRSCAPPISAAITQEVGLLPVRRRYPRSRFFKKAVQESVSLMGVVTSRVLHGSSTAGL